MFILYAIVLGLLLGRLLGGRLDGLAGLSFRWIGVAIAGLAAQVVLFSAPASNDMREIGPLLYSTSTGAVLLFVLVNLRIRGMAVVALGATLNLLAILANGGTMPASRGALAVAGLQTAGGYASSRELASPVLAPLGDVFALPAGVPLANVFSVGDVLIALGILVVIVAAMRGPVPGLTTGAPAEPPADRRRY
ncbi:MAG TPA: DUF5317 family protein [Candidatus Acidoferrales bacterium]|nr:DUF5317 family protein [Candidatus Acidoferrales bacterium]